MSKLLQVLGMAFLLALLGGEIAGLMVLKDRIRIVVALDQPTESVDQLGLLRDEVASLATTVQALQQAVAGSFEQLGQSLSAADATRHEQQQQQLQGLVGQLGDLAQTVAQAIAQAATKPPVVEEPRVIAPPVVIPTAPTAPTVPAAKPPTFLAFSLPTTGFAFDQRHEFALLPELSRVGFDAKSTLHDFTGVTTQVRGSFHAALGGDGDWSGDVEVDAASLDSGVAGRDENMREHLATTQHPQLRMHIARFVPDQDGVDAAKRSVRGTVHGDMTIRGTTRQVAMPVTAVVDPQQRVTISGQMPLKLSDYGVPVPSQLGVINMQDEVTVWVALRARAKQGGAK